jgi:hypothetical protein
VPERNQFFANMNVNLTAAAAQTTFDLSHSGIISLTCLRTPYIPGTTFHPQNHTTTPHPHHKHTPAPAPSPSPAASAASAGVVTTTRMATAPGGGIRLTGVRAKDVGSMWIYGAVRVSGRHLHSRMPLDPTPVRLKHGHACDQWHSSRESTALTVVIINHVETLKARMADLGLPWQMHKLAGRL